MSVVPMFDHVIERARHLARSNYQSLGGALPSVLGNLDYDQYRSIRFRPNAALWRATSPFEVQLFHPGYVYDKPVRIHVVRNQQITELPFEASFFLYDGTAAPVAPLVPPTVGYAGFRVHYPLNDATIKDEVIVFLGASYFRMLGAGHVYGLSSRGLAVDVGLPEAEEFPDFREIWLIQPEPEETTLTLFALLDSPSVAGAYRFDLEPGENTILDVDVRLFARRDVRKLGIAPMSSMFLYDQNRRPYVDDFRAQVHDSDGALVHSGNGEWLWRPLNNGPGTQVVVLTRGTPQGFGLIQRDREFEDYLDLEASYERRPSQWVDVMEGGWGTGRVELLTFETRNEFADNVALYWVPDEPLTQGDERVFRYRLTTLDAREPTQSLAYVSRTRIGLSDLTRLTTASAESRRRIVVDFKFLDGVHPNVEVSEVTGLVEASLGRTFDLVVQPLPSNQGWRASFQLEPSREGPAELRLYLAVGDRPVTETWSYTWHPR